jgi:hypothetical protein
VKPSLDPEYQHLAVTFQSNKFETLAWMVEKVKEKHDIKTEEIHIPESKRDMLTGELLDIYHTIDDGDPIPEEFEKLVLKYWIKGTTQEDKPAYITEPTTSEFIPKEKVNIQINVQPDQDVVVNIDKDLIAEISYSQEVVINVKEIDVKEMGIMKVVENPSDFTIMKQHTHKTGDTPVTLPNSAYRCTMKAINWGKIMDLSSPSAHMDDERKKWSILFEQMSNPSIGSFKDTTITEFGNKEPETTSAFENFLKATAYKDRELLMWAVLVATSREQEELDTTCVNQNCLHRHTLKYSPRGLLHIDFNEKQKRIKDLFDKTTNAPEGSEALKLWKETRSTRRMYKLPESDWMVEIIEPSAYDYMNRIQPLLQSVFERFRPGKIFMENTNEIEDIPVFGYLFPHIVYVKSFSKVIDGVEYRYTNWNQIEEILLEQLTMTESNVVLQLVREFTTKEDPVSFYLENIVCPVCNDTRPKVVVNDIGSTLLFHLSQRQLNTPIEIIEMP